MDMRQDAGDGQRQDEGRAKDGQGEFPGNSGK